MKKPLEPLIPLDDLKAVVARLVALPKNKAAKTVPERPVTKKPSSPKTD